MQLEIDHLKRKSISSCTTKGEDKLPPILTSLLMMKRMIVINPNQGLLLVSLSRMIRTTTISAELGEGDFLGGSLSQRSPCTMVEQTLWST